MDQQHFDMLPYVPFGEDRKKLEEDGSAESTQLQVITSRLKPGVSRHDRA